MVFYKTAVYLLTAFAILVSIIEVYLRVNKIWKRRHEPEVAMSQSVIGLMLGFVTILVWIVYYLLRGEIAGVFDNLIYLIEVTVFILIGAGLWIRSREKRGFLERFKQAFRLEKKEADYLLKQFFKPENPEFIIEILHRLALIDKELAEKEVELISAFAREWNIDYRPGKFTENQRTTLENDFLKLRNLVADYLDRNPDYEQAAQLKDMMSAIIRADKKIASEEELILSELLGLVEAYLKEDRQSAAYRVLVIPQKPGDAELIETYHPDLEKISIAGGMAFSTGIYYSRTFAEMLCTKYRAMNLLTIVYDYKSVN